MKTAYRKFAVLNVIGLSISGFVFTWLSRDGTIDFWLTRHFFDASILAFPLKSSSLLVLFGHTMLKNVTAVGLIIAVVLAILSFWNKGLQLWNKPMVTFCLMAICSALVVQSIKDVSVHACPWDLAMYGGKAEWFPLFDRVKDGIKLGRCWPGGHASGGFAIIAGYFAIRERQPRWARRIMLLGLALGSIMGMVQVARGAHFISHNLWTLWFVWTTCFAIDVLINITSILFHRNQISAVVSPTNDYPLDLTSK